MVSKRVESALDIHRAVLHKPRNPVAVLRIRNVIGAANNTLL